ncbi:glycosyltransferase [Candidatus Woesearchaeota archaeon]|nr:glycosyltransferase [Candidatus Woesearchaeota archaeon]
MTLSIIIPTLNEERYLGTLLNCLSRQTRQDFEVIIVDGTSQDTTVKVAQRYKNRLHLAIVVTRRGVAHQRNEGVRKARFSQLLFFDADCTIANDFIEKTLAYVKGKYTLAGAVVQFDNNDWQHRLINEGYSQMCTFGRFTGGFLNGACIYTTKNVFAAIGGFDTSILVGEDHEFGIRARPHCRRGLLPLPVMTSARRFEQVGPVRQVIQYLMMGLYIMVRGSIRKPHFTYRFGTHN